MPPKKRKSSAPAVIEVPLKEERYILDQKSISRHLFCSICAEVFDNPMRAPCGHSFCDHCIKSWLKNNNTCPEDRKKLTAAALHRDFILNNIVGEVSATCPWRPLGCNFKSSLQSCNEHKDSCPHNPTALPDSLKNYCGGILKDANDKVFLRYLPSSAPKSSAAGPSTSITLPTGYEGGEVAATENVTETVVTPADISVMEDDDVPPLDLPPLRMRMFMNGTADDRSALCRFLDDGKMMEKNVKKRSKKC